MVMTTLRNTLLKILSYKTVSQPISITHRQPSKKRPDNKVVRVSFDDFLYINQLVNESKNAPDNILQGRPDNNCYEAGGPHN